MTIHVINVGQGNCIFVEGPRASGKRTTMIFDGGKEARGFEIIDYLKSIGYPPGSKIDYMVVSHKDADHFEGFIKLLEEGYKIGAFYDNGSKKNQVDYDSTLIPLVENQSDKMYTMKPGYNFNIGNGALVTCMVSAGNILGGKVISNLSENDKSIGLLFEYGEFEFFSAGDLGGGEFSEDKSCTHRSTGQKNIESPLLEAMLDEGFIDKQDGIEILHVSHHGSESSTNYEFMNGLSPAVAVLSVGLNQSKSYEHPRVDIVESVLMAKANCITAKPALVLQTEDGLNSTKTSNKGFAVGDIVIDVFNSGNYRISATGKLMSNYDERSKVGLPITLRVD